MKHKIFLEVMDMQPKVIIVEPDITSEENEENLRQTLEILKDIINL